MIYKQTSELYHHGIKGQKWGIRRYQNEDGTLTEAGKERYYNSYEKSIKDIDKLTSFDKHSVIAKKSEKIFTDSIKNNYIKKELFDELSSAYKKAQDMYSKINSKMYSEEWHTKVNNLTDAQLDYENRLDNLKKFAKEIDYDYKETETYDELFEHNMEPYRILGLESDDRYFKQLKNEVKKNNPKAIKYYNELESIKESKIFKEIVDLYEKTQKIVDDERNIERNMIGSILGKKGEELYDKKNIYVPYNINELIQKYLNQGGN